MQINTFLHEISYISNKQRYEDQAFHNYLMVKLYSVSHLLSMPKVASELPFGHACDKVETKQHDPQTINPVLVPILKRFIVQT